MSATTKFKIVSLRSAEEARELINLLETGWEIVRSDTPHVSTGVRAVLRGEVIYILKKVASNNEI